GACLTAEALGKARPDRLALKPYWGKPAVRNFRGVDGDVGIMRSPVRAIALTDCPTGRRCAPAAAWRPNRHAPTAARRLMTLSVSCPRAAAVIGRRTLEAITVDQEPDHGDAVIASRRSVPQEFSRRRSSSGATKSGSSGTPARTSIWAKPVSGRDA